MWKLIVLNSHDKICIFYNLKPFTKYTKKKGPYTCNFHAWKFITKKKVDKSATKYFHNNTICIEYRSAITQHHNKGDLH